MCAQAFGLPTNSAEEAKFSYSNEMLKVLDVESEWVINRRLIQLSHNVDPYIPGALCDFAIAIPYTSALLAVLASGRLGVYYDPLANIKKTYPGEINKITIGGSKELAQTLSKWTSGIGVIVKSGV